MTKYILSLIAVLTVAACGSGPSLSPEERAVKDAAQARNARAVENAEQTTVNGKTFRVALPEGTDFALVDLVGPNVPFTANDLETAARNVTGCKATVNAGILAFVGGFDVETADLSRLRAKISGNYYGMNVGLQC